MGWFPSPPDPSPALERQTQATEAIAQQQVDLARDQFNYSRTQDAANWQRIQPLIDQQQHIADAQEARSQDYYDYERNTFRPLEQGIVNDAENFNTETSREEMAGKAAADVSQSYSAARDSANRNLARYGINPNSEKFAAVNDNLANNEALARAGAQNNTRLAAKQIGFGMKMDAANMGRGLAANSTAAAQTALNAGNSAVGNQNQTSQVGAGMRQGAIGDFGIAQQGYANSAGIAGQFWNQQNQNYQARMGQIQSGISAIGSIASIMALKDGGDVDEHLGGEVDGPGTSRSDSVPAMLSNGEYVVPAPVVKQLGVRYFDNLIERHGSEQNKQALGQRKAAGIKKFANGGHARSYDFDTSGARRYADGGNVAPNLGGAQPYAADDAVAQQARVAADGMGGASYAKPMYAGPAPMQQDGSMNPAMIAEMRQRAQATYGAVAPQAAAPAQATYGAIAPQTGIARPYPVQQPTANPAARMRMMGQQSMQRAPQRTSYGLRRAPAVIQ